MVNPYHRSWTPDMYTQAMWCIVDRKDHVVVFAGMTYLETEDYLQPFRERRDYRYTSMTERQAANEGFK